MVRGLPTEIPEFLMKYPGDRFSAQALHQHSLFKQYQFNSLEKALRSLADAAKIRSADVSQTRRKKSWLYWWDEKCLPQTHCTRKPLNYNGGNSSRQKQEVS